MAASLFAISTTAFRASLIVSALPSASGTIVAKPCTNLSSPARRCRRLRPAGSCRTERASRRPSFDVVHALLAVRCLDEVLADGVDLLLERGERVDVRFGPVTRRLLRAFARLDPRPDLVLRLLEQALDPSGSRARDCRSPTRSTWFRSRARHALSRRAHPRLRAPSCDARSDPTTAPGLRPGGVPEIRERPRVVM